MRRRFVVVSDVHGFFNELMDALNEVGFNPEADTLISLGDNWDRGKRPLEVMAFLKSLPNKVLVRGNHEDLFVECCERMVAYTHDYSNGTYDTICRLGDYKLGNSFEECCDIALSKTRSFLNSMVNYYETKNYIFVHSFVPLNRDKNLPGYYLDQTFTKMDNWREATYDQWEDARWGNPFKFAEMGLLPDKTLVFGHWHTSWARKYYDRKPEWGSEADFSPYYGNGLIGIDACTAHSGKVNVLVIEDEVI